MEILDSLTPRWTLTSRAKVANDANREYRTKPLIVMFINSRYGAQRLLNIEPQAGSKSTCLPASTIGGPILTLKDSEEDLFFVQ